MCTLVLSIVLEMSWEWRVGYPESFEGCAHGRETSGNEGSSAGEEKLAIGIWKRAHKETGKP